MTNNLATRPEPDTWARGDYSTVATALDSELAELGCRYITGSLPMEWEYLLVIARKLGSQ